MTKIDLGWPELPNMIKADPEELFTDGTQRYLTGLLSDSWLYL